MSNIHDLDGYNERMAKGMFDKIWFLGLISNVKGIYDFGCADGSLLWTIHQIEPSYTLMGYDCNEEMVKLAQQKIPFAEITNKRPDKPLNNICLNASSVFHEIHAYSQAIEADYDHIFKSGAKYIAIRDMFYSEKAVHQTNPVQLANVFKNIEQKRIKEFEHYNGPLTENKNFLHFLLTYRYTENWDREVKENYFPYSIEEFLGKLSDYPYEIVHFEHYTLPFLRQEIQRDFGFTLQDFTHGKILLKRL